LGRRSKQLLFTAPNPARRINNKAPLKLWLQIRDRDNQYAHSSDEMDIDDEDDFYAPDDAPTGAGASEKPTATQPVVKPEDEDLEEGEEEDVGDDDDDSDSV
jgi:hypothetical protein